MTFTTHDKKVLTIINTRGITLLLFGILANVLAGPASAQNVLTNNGNNSRTGAYVETVLSPNNVFANSLFGKIHTWEVDGQINAQPLYVHGLTFADGSVHNVVYAATEKNGVYAFDADTLEKVWTRSLGSPVPWNASGCRKPNLYPWIGITSTPVIDLNSNTIYLVTHNKFGNGYAFRLHALDLVDGHSKIGDPVIAAQIPSSRNNYDSHNHVITFNPRTQLNRPGLLLWNNKLYLAFGGQCDTDFYHGWVFSYDAQTLEQTGVYNTTPTGGRGSVWQSGRGLVADPSECSGGIYFMTGNGEDNFEENDLSESLIHLDFGLRLLDRFTPDNHACLNHNDLELGASGPLLISRPNSGISNRILGGGKEGYLYLFDAKHLAVYLDRKVATHLPEWIGGGVRCHTKAKSGGTDTHHIHSGPVLWDPFANEKELFIYLLGENDHLKAFRVEVNEISPPIATSKYLAPTGMPGGVLSLSYSPKDPSSGLIWASIPLKEDAAEDIVGGILIAFQATPENGDLKLLWHSELSRARDTVGLHAKFCPPTIADGKVFVASFGDPNYKDTSPVREKGCTGKKNDCTRPGFLHMYGLLPTR